MVFLCRVSATAEKGRLCLLDTQLLEEMLKREGEGPMLNVIVEVYRDTRSSAHVRTLWGPIYDQIIDGLSETIGYDPSERDSLHEGLLMLYSGTHRDPATRQEVANKRSSQMTTKEFGEFIEFVARWAATEHGIAIELPAKKLS